MTSPEVTPQPEGIGHGPILRPQQRELVVPPIDSALLPLETASIFQAHELLSNTLARTFGNIRDAEEARDALDAVREDIMSAAFSQRVITRIQDLLRRAYGPGVTDFARRGTAWVTASGTVAIGIEGYHGNPPQWQGAESSVSATLQSAGHYQNLVGVLTWDECASRKDLMSGFGWELVRRHAHPRLDDVAIVGHHNHSDETVITTLNEARGRVGFSGIREPILEQRKAGGIKMPILWKLPRAFDPQNPDPELVFMVRDLLKRVYQNSTSDGKHRPATKGHAAAAISGEYVLLSSNSRDPQWSDQVRCAETSLCASSRAVLFLDGENLSFQSWDATLVYSEDYKDVNGEDDKFPLPLPCEVCCGSLLTHVNSELGDMLLIGLNDNNQFWLEGWLTSTLRVATLKRKERLFPGEIGVRVMSLIRECTRFTS